MPSETSRRESLARSGGFARAVHADHDDDAWFVGTLLIGIEAAIRVSAYELQQLVLQRGTHFGRIGLACDSGVVAQFLDELFAGFRANIGKQKGVFDVFPVGFGKLILRKNVEQSLAERIAGFRQARLKTLHARAGGFGGFMNRFGLGFGGWCRSCRFGRGSLSRGLLLTFSRSFFSCINIGINGRLHRGRISRSRLCFRSKTGVSLGFRILRGLIDGVLAGLTEPPTANHQNCRDDGNGDNRNNHIRIHDSSLKSATDTPTPPRGRTTNGSDSAESDNEPSKYRAQVVRFTRIGQTIHGA